MIFSQNLETFGADTKSSRSDLTAHTKYPHHMKLSAHYRTANDTVLTLLRSLFNLWRLKLKAGDFVKSSLVYLLRVLFSHWVAKLGDFLTECFCFHWLKNGFKFTHSSVPRYQKRPQLSCETIPLKTANMKYSIYLYCTSHTRQSYWPQTGQL